MGHLGAILEPHLGASWGLSGPSWGHLGAILSLSGGAGLSKTLIFQRLFKVFAIGPSSSRLRLFYPILRHLVLFLGFLGVILGPFGHFGAILAHLGAVWGHLGASLGALMGHLGISRVMFCPSWANLVTFGPLLEPSGRLPNPFRGHLAAILGSSWGHLGISWEASFDIAGQLSRPSAVA